MKHVTGDRTASSGNRIFTQCWLPDQHPRAVLVIAHGLSEHSGRYEPIAHYFVERGYAVYTLDHEGHGRSEGQKAYISRLSSFVETLHDYILDIKSDNPGLKTFLIGHSMGGVISANYLLKHQQELDGCILSGAALATGEVIGPALKFALKVLSTLVPKSPIIKLEGEAVSRDPEVVHAYLHDPLVYHGKGTARLIYEIISSADHAMKKAAEVSLPLLILHGSDDALTSPEGSKEFYEHVASEDKTLTIYEDLFHEIFLEIEKLDVYADIEHWLERRV